MSSLAYMGWGEMTAQLYGYVLEKVQVLVVPASSGSEGFVGSFVWTTITLGAPSRTCLGEVFRCFSRWQQLAG